MALLQRFLNAVQAIKASRPKYQQPGDGSNGVCDCIGLIIGAIRRIGLKWTGIHGSNYAARRQTIGLSKIKSVSDLKLADYVYKARRPGEAKYNLPGRYKSGGSYYNGDLNDYYHVGVVTKLNPLNITHMTSPTVKVDTALGQWGYHGQIKPLIEAGGTTDTSSQTEIEIPVSEPIASSGKKAVVIANSGNFVKMRAQPSTSCRLYEQVPVGATVELVQPGEEWAKISYGRHNNWYMMAKFLKVQ